MPLKILTAIEILNHLTKLSGLCAWYSTQNSCTLPLNEAGKSMIGHLL